MTKQIPQHDKTNIPSDFVRTTKSNPLRGLALRIAAVILFERLRTKR
jgi:hypothetical protein